MKEGQFEKRSDLPDQTPGTSIANPPETPKVEHTDKGPRRWPWVLAVLILLSIGAGVFFQRRSSKAEPARGRSAGGPPMLMIGTTTASKGDIGVYVSALGLVTPVNTVSIRSRVDGQLVKVLYREGQAVHQGDPLAEIDPGQIGRAHV